MLAVIKFPCSVFDDDESWSTPTPFMQTLTWLRAYQASGEHHFAVLVHTTEEAIVKYNCKCGRSSPSNCMQPSQLLRHCTHLHLRPTKEDGIYLHTNNTTANFLVTSYIGKSSGTYNCWWWCGHWTVDVHWLRNNILSKEILRICHGFELKCISTGVFEKHSPLFSRLTCRCLWTQNS